eukprot:550959-Pelagomonas_calceolata.AAC.3
MTSSCPGCCGAHQGRHSGIMQDNTARCSLSPTRPRNLDDHSCYPNTGMPRRSHLDLAFFPCLASE